MRAKSRRDRWVEEKMLLKSQMEWVRNFFAHKVETWKDRAGHPSVGHQCYAWKQVTMWRRFAQEAENAVALAARDG